MEPLGDASRSTESVDARVGVIASRQSGVFSRAQAEGAGATRHMIRRRVEAGRWERVGSGVFRVRGAPRTWRQDLMAVCLRWGDPAVVSHAAAAALWRLDGFEPGPVEVTVPRTRRTEAGVHRNAIDPRDITRRDGFRVTTPARTVLDIASTHAPERVEEALDSALRQGMVSVSALRLYLGRSARQGRTGVKVLRALLDARDRQGAVPQSVLETRVLRCMRAYGLPEPVRQHAIVVGGRVIAVADFAYPDVRLVVEADGYRWHSGRRRWERDRERGNDLTLAGWRTIRVTAPQLARDPGGVAAAIATALAGVS